MPPFMSFEDFDSFSASKYLEKFQVSSEGDNQTPGGCRGDVLGRGHKETLSDQAARGNLKSPPGTRLGLDLRNFSMFQRETVFAQTHKHQQNKEDSRQ